MCQIFVNLQINNKNLIVQFINRKIKNKSILKIKITLILTSK